MNSILRKKRAAAGLSLFGLARQVGIRDVIITVIENRKTSAYPKYRRLLSEFFGVPENELFDERGFAREVEEGE
jgi:transcriptional regulator with XRE-family HTH domain